MHQTNAERRLHAGISCRTVVSKSAATVACGPPVQDPIGPKSSAATHLLPASSPSHVSKAWAMARWTYGNARLPRLILASSQIRASSSAGTLTRGATMAIAAAGRFLARARASRTACIFEPRPTRLRRGRITCSPPPYEDCVRGNNYTRAKASEWLRTRRKWGGSGVLRRCYAAAIVAATAGPEMEAAAAVPYGRRVAVCARLLS